MEMGPPKEKKEVEEAEKKTEEEEEEMGEMQKEKEKKKEEEEAEEVLELQENLHVPHRLQEFQAILSSQISTTNHYAMMWDPSVCKVEELKILDILAWPTSIALAPRKCQIYGQIRLDSQCACIAFEKYVGNSLDTSIM